MRIHLVGVALGLSAVLACNDTTTTTVTASLQAVPSIVVIPVGSTRPVVVSAFASEIDPVDASWSIGAVGPGLTVVVDTSYGRLFQGNRLVLPARSHSRRFLVTLTANQSTSFVVSGDAGVLTIPVDPAVP